MKQIQFFKISSKFEKFLVSYICLHRLQHHSQDEVLQMIWLVMRECWESTLMTIFYWHLFLAFIWTFLTKCDKRNLTFNRDIFLQVYALFKKICEWNEFPILFENVTIWFKWHFPLICPFRCVFQNWV